MLCFYYYSFVGIVLSFLLTFLSARFADNERLVVLSIVLSSLVLGMLALAAVNPRLLNVLNLFIRSESKAASVASVLLLSHIRPPGFTKKMNEMLKGEPKKLLRKNIILGLGKYSKKVFSSDLTYQYIRINADYRS